MYIDQFVKSISRLISLMMYIFTADEKYNIYRGFITVYNAIIPSYYNPALV